MGAELPTEAEPVRVAEGDCLDVLASLDRSAVAAVVSDPPYGMRNRTNSKRFTGGHTVPARGEGRDDWPEVIGDDKPFDPTPWLNFPRVVLWGANHFGRHLPVGTTLVWLKKNDTHFGTFLSDAEIGWMKGGHGVYAFRKVFQPPTRAKEGGGRCAHPNQKPIALMEWCINRLRLPPGSLVLDPYAGSGTTGIAAARLGMRCLLVEANPAYAAICRKRVAAALGSGLFAPG